MHPMDSLAFAASVLLQAACWSAEVGRRSSCEHALTLTHDFQHLILL